MSRPGPGLDIALVLGAGGARGLAHIGAIEVLEERGYSITSIVGTSMGALIGATHAAGKLREYRDWVCSLQRGSVLRLLDFAFGFPGLIKGEKVIGAMRELVGERLIEELPIRFTAVATDLATQREVWITRGPLFDAVRASIAIPMIFTPHRINGRDLVDGGLLAPVPIAATRLSMSDRVVAVDVNAMSRPSLRLPDPSAAPEVIDGDDAETEEAEPNGLRERLAGMMDDFFEKRAAAKRVAEAQPGLIDLMSSSLDTMQGQLARLQLAMDPPDLLIKVPHDVCMFYEFWRARELIDIGREATGKALDALQ